MQCKLTKGESKDIYNVTKDFYFKVMLFLNFIFIILEGGGGGGGGGLSQFPQKIISSTIVS